MKHTANLEHIRQYDLFIWSEAYKKEIENESIHLQQYLKNLERLGKRPSILDYENDLSNYLWRIKLYEQQLTKIKQDYELAPIIRASQKVKIGTLISWNKTRQFVWDRDGGVCQICNRKIDFSEYDCGHIVDRVCGGSDRPENLVVMCRLANMAHKPLTETRAKYLVWVSKYQSCDKYYENRVREYFSQLPDDIIEQLKNFYVK